MNWDRIEGNWKQMTGKAREKWGKLTDSDFETVGGQERSTGWPHSGALRHRQRRSPEAGR